MITVQNRYWEIKNKEKRKKRSNERKIKRKKEMFEVPWEYSQLEIRIEKNKYEIYLENDSCKERKKERCDPISC